MTPAAQIASALVAAVLIAGGLLTVVLAAVSTYTFPRRDTRP